MSALCTRLELSQQLRRKAAGCVLVELLRALLTNVNCNSSSCQQRKELRRRLSGFRVKTFKLLWDELSAAMAPGSGDGIGMGNVKQR